MWEFFSNTIVTHLASMLVGAGCAWYVTHKTVIASVVATVESRFGAIASSLKTDIGDIKKDL